MVGVLVLKGFKKDFKKQDLDAAVDEAAMEVEAAKALASLFQPVLIAKKKFVEKNKIENIAVTREKRGQHAIKPQKNGRSTAYENGKIFAINFMQARNEIQGPLSRSYFDKQVNKQSTFEEFREGAKDVADKHKRKFS